MSVFKHNNNYIMRTVIKIFIITKYLVGALFVIVTAFHGLFIFLVHCLRSKDVQSAVGPRVR